MRLILTLSLLLWVWAEVTTFIYISNEIGGLLTLLGIFITAAMGIALLKNQGLSVLKRIRSDMLKGRAPVSSVADSISLIIGGVLVVIPGYFSDVVGLFLFIPGFRTYSGIYIIKWFAYSKKLSSFENLGDNMFKSGLWHYSSTNSRKNPYEYKETPSNPKNFDDIVEGDFIERLSPKPTLKQEKRDQN
ncbi:FxsA family protein [Candidatus Puniceispirillum sp.]|nr:FxsA family protein [Candidatus Puniceispirillum sp.]